VVGGFLSFSLWSVFSPRPFILLHINEKYICIFFNGDACGPGFPLQVLTCPARNLSSLRAFHCNPYRGFRTTALQGSLSAFQFLSIWIIQSNFPNLCRLLTDLIFIL
jgi:hypothetical protein